MTNYKDFSDVRKTEFTKGYEQGKKDEKNVFQMILNKVRKKLCHISETEQGCKGSVGLCDTCEIIEEIEEEIGKKNA